MKDYIEYIVKNEDSYRRTLFFLILIFAVIMFILISITVRKKPLHQIEGTIDLIEKTKVQRENNSTFDIEQRYHFEDVIDIQIDGTSYFVETNFQSRWNDVLDEIHVGERVLISYILTEEGNSICQLEKKESIILDYNDLLKIEFYIKLGLLIAASLILSYVLLLFFKRKNYIKKINTVS